jgi:hypothetical protein
MRTLAVHIELDPRGADFLSLVHNLGHIDDAAMEILTTRLLSKSRPDNKVGFEELRQEIAAFLFEREGSMRHDTRDLLSAEWGRLFS